MFSDLRYAVRSLRRNPGFAAVAILSLALGIGANTAIFTLVDQALLQHLPVVEPERLVTLHAGPLRLQGSSSSDNHETVYSLSMYRSFRERSDVFSGVIARGGVPPAVLGGRSGNEYIGVEIVSGNYFETLGLRAARGRVFTSADDVTPGGHPVVVLTHGSWVRHFGADPAIVNGTIRLNGMPYTVAGVLPERFQTVVKGNNPGVFVPIAMQRQIFPDMDGARPDVRWLNVLARLRDGLSREQAEQAVQSTWQAILEERLQAGNERDADQHRTRRLELLPAERGIDQLRGMLQTPLLVSMATVGFVLLIACVNLAGLLLARAAARARDTAVRLSLGASRVRIIRQALTEALVIATAGGLLSLLLAGWLTAALLQLAGAREDGVLGWRLDWRVLLFTAAACVLTALLFGGIPALQTFAADVASTLKSGSGSVAGGHARLRKGLVSGQIALATALLFGAGLFAQSLLNLMKVDPGFRSDRVMTFLLSPRQAGYDLPRGTQLFQDVMVRLREMPGVLAAGASSPGPMTGSERSGSLVIQGYETSTGEEPGATRHSATPGWFNTLSIPLLMGRDFADVDQANSPKVAIVNEAFVRKYCADGFVLGRRLTWGDRDLGKGMEIIGVAGNVRNQNLRESSRPAVYIPYTQEETLPRMTFYVRMTGDEKAVIGAAREIVRSVDPDLPLYQVRTMQEAVDRTVTTERTMALLSGAFGALAMVLTAIGIYGVIAWTVARRTNEIALRMALGAMPARVLRLVMGEVVLTGGVGIVVGVGLAFAGSRLVASRLYGVAPQDPTVLVLAVGCAGAMTGLAALLPALRATRIAPAQALRMD